MNVMRTPVACLSLLVLIVSSAPVSAKDWSGLYVGGYLSRDIGDVGSRFTGDQTVENVSINIDGFTGGVFGGYNFQLGSLLLGVEGDVNLLDTEKTRSFDTTIFGIPDTYNYGIKHTFSGNIRARLGVLVTDNLLLYAAGGVAFERYESNLGFVTGVGGNTVTSSGSTDKMLTGYTIGGGLEAKLLGSILLRAEYLYSGIGSERFSTTLTRASVDAVVTNDTSLDSHTVRLGVALKF